MRPGCGLIERSLSQQSFREKVNLEWLPKYAGSTRAAPIIEKLPPLLRLTERTDRSVSQWRPNLRRFNFSFESEKNITMKNWNNRWRCPGHEKNIIFMKNSPLKNTMAAAAAATFLKKGSSDPKWNTNVLEKKFRTRQNFGARGSTRGTTEKNPPHVISIIDFSLPSLPFNSSSELNFFRLHRSMLNKNAFRAGVWHFRRRRRRRCCCCRSRVAIHKSRKVKDFGGHKSNEKDYLKRICCRGEGGGAQ